MVIELTESLISGKPSYNRIAEIHTMIRESEDNDIYVNVNIEKRLGLSFLFYISTLPFLGESLRKNVHIYCNEKSIKLLRQLGYIEKKADVSPSVTDVAPLLIESSTKINDKENVFAIVSRITTEAPVILSAGLEELFVSKVGEMFNNALEHAGTPRIIGAKYFKRQKDIYTFACYDTGCGIPAKVNEYLGESKVDVEALEWAMQRGHSTANEGGELPRGLGLDLLHAFARANHGTIRICSGKALYIYEKGEKGEYYELSSCFLGTLYEMDIIADNEYQYTI